jgi:arginine:ornithine antiporter/lysine permease
MVFYFLTHFFPTIEGGMFNYANHGFGPFVGSLTGWGHWISMWVGNCSFFVLIFATLGYFFPIFENGTTWPAFFGAVILALSVSFFILRGLHGATILNSIIVVTKFLPILVFIIICFTAARKEIFILNLDQIHKFSASDIFEQVKTTMVTTMWVFLGIEGAITVSGEAKDKKDVANASVIGFISVALIYLLITFLSFSIMSQSELENLQSPAMGYILDYLVGPWGGKLISIAIIISVLGAMLSWTILAAEIPYIGAKNEKLYPKFFTKTNKNGAPIGSLVITTICTSLFLLWIKLSKTGDGYRAAFEFASVAAIFPYLLSALFALKMTLLGKTYKTLGKRIGSGAWVLLAVLYALWLCLALDTKLLLFVLVLYIPGVFVYLYARKQNKQTL